MAYFLISILCFIVAKCTYRIVCLMASVDTLEKDVEILKKNKQDVRNCTTCKHEGNNGYCLHPNPYVSSSFLHCVHKGYKYWEIKL